MEHTIITTENIDEVCEKMLALDQALDIEIGCITWTVTCIRDTTKIRQVTVFPSTGRCAICFDDEGIYSIYGDWSEKRQLLLLDTGAVFNAEGKMIELNHFQMKDLVSKGYDIDRLEFDKASILREYHDLEDKSQILGKKYRDAVDLLAETYVYIKAAIKYDDAKMLNAILKKIERNI